MKPIFWIKRFLVVFAGVFLILLAVGFLRGRAPRTIAFESVFWSLITTGIFLVTRLIRSRKAQHCELCGDLPELSEGGRLEVKPAEHRP